jgi:hypothetical protein
VNSGGFAFPVSADKLDDRLRPGDFVLALDVDGVHVAYPLSRREARLINSEVSGRPIFVLTDPDAPGGIAFFAEVDGRALTFEFGADGAIADNETASVWDAAGRALSGALAGSSLEAVPARTSFWFSIVGAVPDIDLRIR